jgi:hypothetical protein
MVKHKHKTLFKKYLQPKGLGAWFKWSRTWHQNMEGPVPVAHTCNPSYSGGRVQNQPGQIIRETLSQKYSAHKRTGGVTQVIKCLPSKHKALSSNHSTTKKTKNIKHTWDAEKSAQLSFITKPLSWYLTPFGNKDINSFLRAEPSWPKHYLLKVPLLGTFTMVIKFHHEF